MRGLRSDISTYRVAECCCLRVLLRAAALVWLLSALLPEAKIGVRMLFYFLLLLTDARPTHVFTSARSDKG